MGRLISMMSLSLDGFINDRYQSLGWQSIDEELHTCLNEQCATVGGFIHGRTMHELMHAFWPTADQDPASPDYVIEFARIWRQTPKTIISRTMTKAPAGYSLIRDNVAQEVAALKAVSTNDLMVGGPTITQYLAQQGLVDIYKLFIHPVVLGVAAGTPMFAPSDHPATLRLTDHHRFDSGVVYLEYQRAD